MSLLKDPNTVAVRNSQLFGLDVTYEEAQILALSIPWDVTTSYRPGTVAGPEAILNASYQLDLNSPILLEAWKLALHSIDSNKEWQDESNALRKLSSNYIEFLESGGDITTSLSFQKDLSLINKKCQELTEKTSSLVSSFLNQKKSVLSIGGDHGTSLGPIKAYSQKYSNLSILHFDAHADLRPAYEGFIESHASIMYNVMETLPIKQLVQVGIRDVSPIEINYINSNPKISTHFDWELKNQLSEGVTWKALCEKIIQPLTDDVYISFDIDGLDPKLCPNTGTPVPGGLELWQVQYLIERLLESGRKLRGADLVEVAPHPLNHDEWDGNVGARAAFMLACALQVSQS